MGGIAALVEPTRDTASGLVHELAEVVAAHPNEWLQDEQLRRLKKKIASVGASHLEVLLAEAQAALSKGVDDRDAQDNTESWRRYASPVPRFWQLVLDVACDLAQPSDRELILRYHSPRVDLLRVIEPMGWGDAALGKAVVSANAVVSFGQVLPESWLEFFAKHSDDATRAVLLAQVRLGAVSSLRLADWMHRGVLPAREAASAQWEVAFARCGSAVGLATAFSMALKHGVEAAPREGLRVLRLPVERLENASGGLSARQVQSSFTQALSLHSDCPADAEEGAAWMEQNASALLWDEATGRYELPGKAGQMANLSAWGEYRDDLGAGRTEMLDDGALSITTGSQIVAWDHGTDEHTAPRMVREVTGDFTAEVTVLPSFELGDWWKRNGSGKDEEKLFQAAGLLLDAGEARWLRYERAVWKTVARQELREEIFQSGLNHTVQHAPRETASWDASQPMRLRIARHGDWFYTAQKFEGTAWIVNNAWPRCGWPATLCIGPSVINTTTHRLSARFSDFIVRAGSELPTNLELKQPLNLAGDATPTGTEIAGWGRVENPGQGGVILARNMQLGIACAAKEFDMNSMQRMNAPRVIQEVDGDFSMEVTIAPVQERDWSSAEVLLQAGSDFYIRFGPAFSNGLKRHIHGEHVERGWRCYTPYVVPWDQHLVETQTPRLDASQPLRFRVQRKGVLLHIAWQQAGGAWTELYPYNLHAWPKKWQVGVVVQNVSSKEFTAVFSDFVLQR